MGPSLLLQFCFPCADQPLWEQARGLWQRILWFVLRSLAGEMESISLGLLLWFPQALLHKAAITFYDRGPPRLLHFCLLCPDQPLWEQAWGFCALEGLHGQQNLHQALAYLSL